MDVEVKISEAEVDFDSAYISDTANTKTAATEKAVEVQPAGTKADYQKWTQPKSVVRNF